MSSGWRCRLRRLTMLIQTANIVRTTTEIQKSRRSSMMAIVRHSSARLSSVSRVCWRRVICSESNKPASILLGSQHWRCPLLCSGAVGKYRSISTAANRLHVAAAIDQRDRQTVGRTSHRSIDAHRQKRAASTNRHSSSSQKPHRRCPLEN